MAILVLNCGSSSLKYSIVDPADPPGSVAVDTIELSSTTESAYLSAVTVALDAMAGVSISGVGHRVVHGGPRFAEPVVIDDRVLAEIEACVPLAPQHNPAAIATIRAAKKALPDIAHVAVFDTAFHRTIPPVARTYAIPSELSTRLQIEKYGFHGTSHQYVGQRTAAYLGLGDQHRIISLHLGNGASACAIKDGHSVDTTMGMTPVAGLVMGTRSGDVDPAVALLLAREESVEAADQTLNKSSGLLGVGGTADMRELQRKAEAGDGAAQLARELFVYRIVQTIGSYLVVLGGVDALVFTAGIGEHNSWVRAQVMQGLAALNVVGDDETNHACYGPDEPTVISTSDSGFPCLVVPTNEEYAIAQAVQTLVG